MSTTTTSTTSATTSTTRLRRALMFNAEFSAISGIAALVAGSPIATLLGVEQVWLIRLLGAGLLVFALSVFLVSKGDNKLLRAGSLEISLADLGWMIGTALVIALGWLSTTGAIVMGAIAALVLGFGVAQLSFRRVG